MSDAESSRHTRAPFQGFRSPNYTAVPDELFDELLPELTGAELKVLLYICRRTFGFKKGSDTISLAQMLHGIQTRDGRVLDRGVGLSKKTLLQALQSLRDRSIILTARQYSVEKGNEPTAYALNMADPTPGVKSTPPLGEKLHQGGGGETTPSPRGKNYTIQETVEQETEKHLSKVRRLAPTGERGDVPEPIAPAPPSARRGGTASLAELLEPEQQRLTGRVAARVADPPAGHGTPAEHHAGHRNGHAAPAVTAAPVDGASSRRRTPSHPRRGRPEVTYDEDRQVISAYIEDFARELNDTAPLTSSVSRAHNLYRQAGLHREAFISKLYEARTITREHATGIRSRAGDPAKVLTPKKKMAYFFAVLEDVLGLKDQPAAGVLPD